MLRRTYFRSPEFTIFTFSPAGMIASDYGKIFVCIKNILADRPYNNI